MLEISFQFQKFKNRVYFEMRNPKTKYLHSEVDECGLGLHKCDVKATCENTEGSYICSCTHGYFGDGFTCKRKYSNQFLEFFFKMINWKS